MKNARKMFALVTAVFMTACLFAMFGAPDVQAAATAPNMDRRPRNSTFIDKNRKTAIVPVAAIANNTPAPAVLFVCPYDATILEVAFLQTGANGSQAPTASNGLLNYNVNIYTDGGAVLTGRAATTVIGTGTYDASTPSYDPVLNGFTRFQMLSTRACKAGDKVMFEQTVFNATGGTADYPAGVLEITYTIQDVVAYTRDGGLI